MLALKHPQKVHSLVLVAPGINFAQRFIENVKKTITPSTMEKIEAGGIFELSSEYGTFPVSMALANDLIEHNLDLEDGLDIKCPVRIIHGMQVRIFGTYIIFG